MPAMSPIVSANGGPGLQRKRLAVDGARDHRALRKKAGISAARGHEVDAAQELKLSIRRQLLSRAVPGTLQRRCGVPRLDGAGLHAGGPHAALGPRPGGALKRPHQPTVRGAYFTGSDYRRSGKNNSTLLASDAGYGFVASLG